MGGQMSVDRLDAESKREKSRSHKRIADTCARTAHEI